MSADFNKLVPELPLYNDGKGIDIEGYLSSIGDYPHAIAYAELFWPPFVEHDGCIFRGAVDEEVRKAYEDWVKATNGNKTSVEAVMNHVHILDIFPCAKELPSREQIVYLGRKLKNIWETKLKRDFPDRTVIVSFPEEHSEDLLDYNITLYQPREEDAT